MAFTITTPKADPSRDTLAPNVVALGFARTERTSFNSFLCVHYEKGAEDGVEFYFAFRDANFTNRFYEMSSVDPVTLEVTTEKSRMTANGDKCLAIPLGMNFENVRLVVAPVGVVVPTGTLEIGVLDGGK